MLSSMEAGLEGVVNTYFGASTPPTVDTEPGSGSQQQADLVTVIRAPFHHNMSDGIFFVDTKNSPTLHGNFP